MENIKFIVSEWGFHTEFNKFEDAINYCKLNDINGEDGVIWIQGDSKYLLEKFMQENEVNYDLMIFKCIDKSHNWIWDSVMEEWEDATEIENDGAEDFEQKFEERKEYIENRYGKDHGKKIK